jgi:hypothetical protein
VPSGGWWLRLCRRVQGELPAAGRSLSTYQVGGTFRQDQRDNLSSGWPPHGVVPGLRRLVRKSGAQRRLLPEASQPGRGRSGIVWAATQVAGSMGTGDVMPPARPEGCR